MSSAMSRRQNLRLEYRWAEGPIEQYANSVSEADTTRGGRDRHIWHASCSCGAKDVPPLSQS